MTAPIAPPPPADAATDLAAAIDADAAATRPARRAPRCDADYRWTMPKVAAFLAALAKCGRVAEAAAAVGMSRQSAYRLRARLAGTRYAGAFDGARRQGQRARAAASLAASRARAASRWAGPSLGDYLRGLALRDDSTGAQGDKQSDRQGDSLRTQGDRVVAESDNGPRQGDGGTTQGDTAALKATRFRLDRVTGVTGAAGGEGQHGPARLAVAGSGD